MTYTTFRRLIDTVAISAIVSVLVTMFYVEGHKPPPPSVITLAEKKAVMLRECFPEGIYNPDAASTCPAFKASLVDEMNEGGDGQ